MDIFIMAFIILREEDVNTLLFKRPIEQEYHIIIL